MEGVSECGLILLGESWAEGTEFYKSICSSVPSVPLL